VVLIGIRTGGIFLAQRLRQKISTIEGWRCPWAFWTSPCTGTTC
jgi:pyrimidine operon attenuation protein/uracil phosphoribosyltransferase